MSSPAVSARPTKDQAKDQADGLWSRQSIASRVIYWGIHAGCLLGFVTGVTTADLVLCFCLVYVRMFAITGGYHRYFAHKTYKTGRVFQMILAVIGCASIQKGPIWWAAGHRRHHKYSDEEGDMHSPREGFYYAHQGWVFDDRWGETEVDLIPDFARFPELMWLNRWHIVPPTALAVLCAWFGGLSGFVWGFCVSTTILWHFTYSVNSLAHVWGTRRYDTGDTSRNNLLVALATMGEGWHNNHHRYQASTRQGFFWWEVDATYYILRGLQAIGVVWDIREPPMRLLEPATEAQPLREAA